MRGTGWAAPRGCSWGCAAPHRWPPCLGPSACVRTPLGHPPWTPSTPGCARQAVPPPSGVQKPREARLSRSRAGLPGQGAPEAAPETKLPAPSSGWSRFLDLSGAGQAPGKREGRARTAAGSGGLSTERRSACPLTPSYLSSLIISGGRLSWSRGGGGGAVAEGAQPSPHGPAMFFPEPPAQPWSQQRTAFAGPVLLQGGPELSPGPPRPGAWSLTQA